MTSKRDGSGSRTRKKASSEASESSPRARKAGARRTSTRASVEHETRPHTGGAARKPRDQGNSAARTPAKQSAGKAQKGEDVLLVHGVSESGDAYQVLRAREDRIEAGIVKPL